MIEIHMPLMECPVLLLGLMEAFFFLTAFSLSFSSCLSFFGDLNLTKLSTFSPLLLSGCLFCFKCWVILMPLNIFLLSLLICFCH
jgi:hypothetical protein